MSAKFVVNLYNLYVLFSQEQTANIYHHIPVGTDCIVCTGEHLCDCVCLWASEILCACLSLDGRISMWGTICTSVSVSVAVYMCLPHSQCTCLCCPHVLLCCPFVSPGAFLWMSPYSSAHAPVHTCVAACTCLCQWVHLPVAHACPCDYCCWCVWLVCIGDWVSFYVCVYPSSWVYVSSVDINYPLYSCVCLRWEGLIGRGKRSSGASWGPGHSILRSCSGTHL